MTVHSSGDSEDQSLPAVRAAESNDTIATKAGEEAAQNTQNLFQKIPKRSMASFGVGGLGVAFGAYALRNINYAKWDDLTRNAITQLLEKNGPGPALTVLLFIALIGYIAYMNLSVLKDVRAERDRVIGERNHLQEILLKEKLPTTSSGTMGRRGKNK